MQHTVDVGEYITAAVRTVVPRSTSPASKAINQSINQAINQSIDQSIIYLFTSRRANKQITVGLTLNIQIRLRRLMLRTFY